MTKHKVAAYSEYLAERRTELETALATAADELRAKVAALAADKEAGATAPG